MAYLLITEAVGRSGSSQLTLIDVPTHPQLAAYAIWDPEVRTDGIARMVLLNLAVRNISTSASDAEEMSVTVDVGELVKRRGSAIPSEAAVKRMSSPGLDSKDVSKVLWAGQSYESGIPLGEELVESTRNRRVTVQGSEGVLVFF